MEKLEFAKVAAVGGFCLVWAKLLAPTARRPGGASDQDRVEETNLAPGYNLRPGPRYLEGSVRVGVDNSIKVQGLTSI